MKHCVQIVVRYSNNFATFILIRRDDWRPRGETCVSLFKIFQRTQKSSMSYTPRPKRTLHVRRIVRQNRKSVVFLARGEREKFRFKKSVDENHARACKLINSGTPRIVSIRIRDKAPRVNTIIRRHHHTHRTRRALLLSERVDVYV